MKKPCIETHHLGEVIQIFENEFGAYYFESTTTDGLITWSSHFDFAEPLEALSICILHQECTQIDAIEQPAAIFSLDTGKILHTNKPHHQWLGHGCIQMHRDTVLSRVVSPERVTAKLLPIGNRVVGMYQISGAAQVYQFNTPHSLWTGVWEGVTALYGFAHYGVESQRILSRWIELGDGLEFRRSYIRDLDKLDQLQGMAQEPR